MQARICDECKNVIEGMSSQKEPLEITEGNFRLVIDVSDTPQFCEDFELCPACVKKGRYQVAKKAFESLKNKKAKKDKPAAPQEGQPPALKEEKPGKKK